MAATAATLGPWLAGAVVVPLEPEWPAKRVDAIARDAGLAAAKVVTHLREIATSFGGNQRATCGMIQFQPNAINVIPSKAIFTVDLRNSDGDALKQAEAMLLDRVKKVEAEDGVTIEVRALEHVLPVQFHPMVIQAVEGAVQNLGLKYQRMVSGAGHDAQLMAHKFPSAMIFVPSRSRRSIPVSRSNLLTGALDAW